MLRPYEYVLVGRGGVWPYAPTEKGLISLLGW